MVMTAGVSNTSEVEQVSASRTNGTAESWREEPPIELLPLQHELNVQSALADWVEKFREAHQAVRVLEGHILINESAMIRDSLYPTTVDGSTYYVVLWSHDGAIEIYGAGP